MHCPNRKDDRNNANQSNSHYNTKSAREQKFVEKFLLQGESNAIPTRDLVRFTGLSSARQLQACIADERRRGALILSTNKGGGGYFLPSDGEAGRREIAEFVSTLHSRAVNTLRVLSAARAALAEMDGQMQIDETGG